MRSWLRGIFRIHDEQRVGDERLAILKSENREEVIRVVESLSSEKEGGLAEAGLIDIVAACWEDESSAPLWAMIILGKIGSFRAVPMLLRVLESEADYWQEAAAEALTLIALKHGEKVLVPLESFIEDRLVNDPFDCRIYAYEPFSALTTSSRAERFLVRMLEEDRRLAGSIAHDLVPFGNIHVLPMLRRAIEFAKRSADIIEERELRDAYCLLDGALPEDPHEPLWRKPWQERWSRQLDYLGRDEEEIDRMESGMFDIDPDKRRELDREAAEEADIRDGHPLAEFDLEAYLRIRERCPMEEDFQSALRLCGLDDRWDVERVQTLLGRSRSLEHVLEQVLGDGPAPPSFGAEEEFKDKLFELWAITPREDEQGLSPDDLEEIPALREANRRAYRRFEKESRKILADEKAAAETSELKTGRNDPCPCGAKKEDGSPVKYKHCHGR